MLTGVMIILIFVIVLLAIPVVLTFKVSRDQTFQGGVKILWLFGLVRVHRPLFQTMGSALKAKESEHQNNRFLRSSEENSNVFAAIRDKTFRQRVLRFLSDSWHAIDKQNINLRMRIGLGDPVETGQLWAVVGPIAGILSNIQEGSIEVLPDFVDSRFELDSSGKLRLVPLQLIYLTVGLILSPSFWQGLRTMRTAG